MIKLSLIGMSGAGKSFWTQKLAAAGFRAMHIDDAIEQKLGPDLAQGGYTGTSGLASWMGWPDQPSYAERAQKYLTREIEAMRDALDEIETRSSGEGIVLDTTGSVVYLGDEILRRLQVLTTVVYLAATSAEETTLMERYLGDPKPVLWADQFSQHSGEPSRAAVERCYPALIASRRRLYEKCAHRIVPLALLRDGAIDARRFLELLDSQARPAQ